MNTGMISKPTNAYECVKVYYTHRMPPTCSGHLYDHLQEDGHMNGRHIFELCGAYNVLSCTYVHWLVLISFISICSMQDYGSCKIVNTVRSLIIYRFAIIGVSL